MELKILKGENTTDNKKQIMNKKLSDSYELGEEFKEGDLDTGKWL